MPVRPAPAAALFNKALPTVCRNFISGKYPSSVTRHKDAARGSRISERFRATVQTGKDVCMVDGTGREATELQATGKDE